jgi:hypothetical protein
MASSIPRRSMVRALLVSLFMASGAMIFGMDSGEVGGFMAMTPYVSLDNIETNVNRRVLTMTYIIIDFLKTMGIMTTRHNLMV